MDVNQWRCDTIQVFKECQDLEDQPSFQQAALEEEELQVGEELICVQVKIVVNVITMDKALIQSLSQKY